MNQGMEMGKVAPFKRFPLIESYKIDEAEDAIRKSLSDVTIMHVEHPSRFQVKMTGMGLGCASMVYTFFGARTRLKAGQPENYVYLILSGERPTAFLVGKTKITISPTKAALISPERLKSIDRSENSEVLAIRFSKQALMQQIEKLTDRYHSGTISFQHSVDLSSDVGAMISRTIKYVIHELNYTDLAPSHPGFLQSLDQLLVSALLTLPHNKSEHLEAGYNTNPAPGVVRRAEEYMRENLANPITILDVLQVSACSRSVLFSSFKRARNYTPMEFLTEQRLQKARNTFLHSEDTDSVSSVAINSGFTNLGRFAQTYANRFGELPSDTLKKSYKRG